MNNITVKLDLTAKTIDIFGGKSGYPEESPYYIDFDRCNEPDWLCHLRNKQWMNYRALRQVSTFIDQVRRGVVR